MAVYPRHKAVVDAFVAKGEVIGIGPFADLGNMAIFRTREAAEAFTKQDPFILERLDVCCKPDVSDGGDWSCASVSGP